jgi:hypothetical protein
MAAENQFKLENHTLEPERWRTIDCQPLVVARNQVLMRCAEASRLLLQLHHAATYGDFR